MFFSRGKNTIQNPYTFQDMYYDYISDIDKNSPYYVTYAEYVDICSIFYKEISQAIIEEGIKFKLPYSLGEVYVIKKKKLLSLPDLIGVAREIGVHIIACQMAMEVMGIHKEELIDGIDYGGVATYLADARDSKVTLFV